MAEEIFMRVNGVTGGLTFEIGHWRFAARLTAPFSDERLQAASELAKKNRLKGRV